MALSEVVSNISSTINFKVNIRYSDEELLRIPPISVWFEMMENHLILIMEMIQLGI